MRYALSDAEWPLIAPVLPSKSRGVPPVDDRRVLNGIFRVLKSGAPWRDLPERYGPTLPATIGSFVALYRHRNHVERFFNRIKHCRRIATRYEKHAANFLAFVKLAAISLWLRFYESPT